MTPRALVVLGGGEHARVVIEAARSRPDRWLVTGFTDRGEGRSILFDVPCLGDDLALTERLAALSPADRPALVLGFGGPLATRRAAADAFIGVVWATIIHADAWVSPSAVVEPGVVVLAGAVINAGARVGAQAIVNSRAVVEHDVEIGAGAHVGPGAVVGGGTSIGDGALIGLAAAVRDHILVGRRAVVGMGSVVVADVADDATVMGVPARPAAVRPALVRSARPASPDRGSDDG